LPASEGSLVAVLHLLGCPADPSGLTWTVNLAMQEKLWAAAILLSMHALHVVGRPEVEVVLAALLGAAPVAVKVAALVVAPAALLRAVLLQMVRFELAAAATLLQQRQAAATEAGTADA